jgi:two-component system chemotaxis response regulator CheY
MRILIVDDDENQLDLIESFIEKYAEQNRDFTYFISQVRTGMSAVEFEKMHRYDLIFMDIIMPMMNGIEATRHIKRTDPETVIVAISSDSDEKSVAAIMSAGADEFIAKPINAQMVYDALRRYASR